jgi:hypothetical protein
MPYPVKPSPIVYLYFLWIIPQHRSQGKFTSPAATVEVGIFETWIFVWRDLGIFGENSGFYQSADWSGLDFS